MERRSRSRLSGAGSQQVTKQTADELRGYVLNALPYGVQGEPHGSHNSYTYIK